MGTTESEATNAAGITDSVSAELNPPPYEPDPNAKPPGDQWPVDDRTTSRRAVDKYQPAEDGEVKGPHPDDWSDEARDERGAEIADPPEPTEEPPTGEVKGPDPAQWGDDARAERGAISDTE